MASVRELAMTAVIRPARSEAEIGAVRHLFQEYANSLDVDLTFQGFAAELAQLPGSYAPPAGELLLALTSGHIPVGCVGVRPLTTDRCCEMKRLYVHASARGTGLGHALALRAIHFAQAAGYTDLVLDTLPTMTGAQSLYRALGFERTAQYYDNPMPHVLYFRRQLLPRTPEGV